MKGDWRGIDGRLGTHFGAGQVKEMAKPVPRDLVPYALAINY